MPSADLDCAQELRVTPGSVERENWGRAWATESEPEPSTQGRTLDEPRSGKWLFRWTCGQAPDGWVRLAAATRDGQFLAAKVVLDHPPNVFEHQVCVYTADFCDVADVRTAGIRLWQLEIVPAKATLWYKPDTFTEDLLYSVAGTSASIFRLRAGQTYLATTPGIAHLPADLQRQIEANAAALEPLPKGRDLDQLV